MTPNPYLYGANLLDFTARTYDPSLPLFQPQDPKAGDYTQFNTYLYCGEDPINRVDKDGKQFIAISSPFLGASSPTLLSVSDPILMSSNKPIIRPATETLTKSFGRIEWHHIIPKSFRNNQIVKDATTKGFKLNEGRNLTPLEKFIRVKMQVKL